VNTCKGLKTAAAASGLLVAGLVTATAAGAACTDAKTPFGA